MPGLLLIQEQIQAPENASLARFDGLGCYQNGSVKKAVAAAISSQTAPPPAGNGQSAKHHLRRGSQLRSSQKQSAKMKGVVASDQATIKNSKTARARPAQSAKVRIRESMINRLRMIGRPFFS